MFTCVLGEENDFRAKMGEKCNKMKQIACWRLDARTCAKILACCFLAFFTTSWRPDAQWLALRRPEDLKVHLQRVFERFFRGKTYKKDANLVLTKCTSWEKIWSKVLKLWKSVNGEIIRDSSPASHHE